MAAHEISSPNTGASLAAQADPSVIWQRAIKVSEQTSDFFQQFEGSKPDAMIRTETDTSKGVGQKVKFRTMAGFYDEPHEGDELFETEDDFEEFVMNEYELEVDFLRHAVRYTERAEEYMGIRGELMSGVPIELGKWAGRIKSERMFMTMRERADAANKIFAGGRSSSTLLSTDTLKWDEIVAGGTQLKRLGGVPAVTKVSGDQRVKAYNVLASTDSLFSLEVDPTYKTMLQTAGDRGKGNLLFTGGYSNVRGHMICEYNPIDHDGEGAVGSPLNPKAFLGVAIAAGTAAFTIKGGGNAVAAAKTKKKYFKWFPGHAYRFLPSDVMSVDAGPHYLMIVNPPTGTEANLIGIYEYTTGNSGHDILITKRLGASTTGDQYTTVGSVTYNAGAFPSSILATQHPVGATILPVTPKGVVYGDSIIACRSAALRGYGKYRNKRGQEAKEDDFIRDVFFKTVFGQTLRKDTLGRTPGLIRLRHAVTMAGMPIPSVTA